MDMGRCPPALHTWPDGLHCAVLRHLGGPRQVAGYLRPYSELCRACAAAACATPLWRDVDLSGYHLCGLASGVVLALLSRYGRGVVERLSLRGLKEVDDGTVRSIAELLSNGPLRSLDLSGCPGVSGAVLAVLQGIPTLEELGVECVGLNDEDVAELCKHCPRLTRLDVRHCEALTDASALLGGATVWTSLQLDGCFRLDVGWLLAEPLGTWYSLEVLSLDGEDLKADDFVRLAKACPRLRQLAVSFARELEPSALAALVALSRLECLVLKKATKPCDASWASFFVEQRRRANAEECAVPVDNRRATGMWTLLNVAESELFADTAACAFAAVPQPALTDVDLSWCWHLTDAGLRTLLSAAPSLQRVKLAGMKSLTGAGLSPCCRLASLEELDCTSCNSIADGVLEFLHRLFLAPPGASGEALPGSIPLPPRVALATAALWSRRRRWAARLQIKNYYGEFLPDWGQLRPPGDVCAEVEALFTDLGEFG